MMPEKTVHTETAPSFAIAVVNLQDLVEVFDGFGEILARSENGANRIHSLNRVGVGPNGLFVCE